MMYGYLFINGRNIRLCVCVCVSFVHSTDGEIYD